jgi:uncharacterized membrane protein YdjX (TVP38/TMEM64 family)
VKRVLLRVGVVTVIALLIIFARDLPIVIWLGELEVWAKENPLAGALAYVALTVFATVALMPGWISMMLAGLLFGLSLGLLYAMLGIIGGAAAAFVVGRTLARSWVERRIAGNVHLMALDDALDEQAFSIVALTRIALVFPFNILNYAYGVTRVRFAVYVAGTGVGMLPIVGIYVYLGTLTQNLGQILSEGASIGPGAWWAIAVAAVAIITVILIVRRALDRALQRRIKESEVK